MRSGVIKASEELGKLLSEKGLKITTVESCTGGGVAQAITAVTGSSEWFDMGFVTYANKAKELLVGVDPKTLSTYGAVSEETVYEMARGALKVANANIAVATSGIAGPGGGSPDKPVGLVWFAWAVKTSNSCEVLRERRVFSGDRESVQAQAIQYALEGASQKVLDYCM